MATWLYYQTRTKHQRRWKNFLIIFFNSWGAAQEGHMTPHDVTIENIYSFSETPDCQFDLLAFQPLQLKLFLLGSIQACSQHSPLAPWPVGGATRLQVSEMWERCSSLSVTAVRGGGALQAADVPGWRLLLLLLGLPQHPNLHARTHARTHTCTQINTHK